MAAEPLIRRGVPADAQACHDVMWASATDLGSRRGMPLPGSASDWWARGESLHRFLADHAAEWWVAQEPEGDALIGYARSIERGRLLELTEFFVLPGHQSAGLGRALLARAFASGRGEVRSIIATMDVRALGRYYQAGTVARFPILSLAGAPRPAPITTDLAPEPIDAGSRQHRRELAALDESVLDFARSDAEVSWLLETRQGTLYRRGGKVVGVSFVGLTGAGPVAVRDAADLPAILLDVENRAVAAGIDNLDFQVPSPNEVATRHLLSRGFQIDPWINLLLSNRRFGNFDKLVSFGPPLFL